MSETTAGLGSGGPPPKPPESVDEAIARLKGEVADAKKARDVADGRLTAVDGQLTAMLNLKRDSDKATDAYKTAHGQLTIGQRDLQDYFVSATESLAKLLENGGLDKLKEKVDAKRDLDASTARAVADKRQIVATAEQDRAAAATDRTAKADTVTSYQTLPATIGAAHTKLNAQFDEAMKARKAGEYALAYWLLTGRDFEKVLTDTGAALIAPEELPDRLRAAVAALGDAEQTLVGKTQQVAESRAELKDAEQADAEQKAKGEATLRDQLRAITAAQPAPEA